MLEAPALDALAATPVLVTGGAGFIGSALVRHLVADTSATVINVDALTYAGNLESLAAVADHPRYRFVHADVRDRAAMRRVFEEHAPATVIHLAAESHVDRSIDAPATFIDTNIVGTFVLLEEARRHWHGLDADARARFRFVHVSTDEVFGSLGADGVFCEDTPYRPNSPYAASKAAADHLAHAWHATYGLPVVITNCSNNYGPFQYPEKLIPLMIAKALAGEPLPVYGRGENVRDWLFVDDHADALWLVARRGQPGRAYAIGARNELRNLDLVHRLCAVLAELRPGTAATVEFVADRPGHDLRYAIDPSRVERELGWRPRHDFERGLRETVRWYLDHGAWCDRVRSGAYRGQRLGLGTPA